MAKERRLLAVWDVCSCVPGIEREKPRIFLNSPRANRAENAVAQIVKEKISSALKKMREISDLQDEITVSLAREARTSHWHEIGGHTRVR